MQNSRKFFNYFPHLANIEVSQVASWLSCDHPQLLENKLGNKILYSQAVPLSTQDLLFDLCLLREVLKLHPEDHLNLNLKKIYIAEDFLEMFPNLQELSLAFVDALGPLGITAIATRFANSGYKTLGTLIKPELLAGSGEIKIEVLGKKYQVKVGSLVVIPANSPKVDIKFDCAVAKLLGNNFLIAEVVGGAVGIIVDARKSISPCKICLIDHKVSL